MHCCTYFFTVPGVETAAEVPVDWRGGRVHKDGGRQQTAALRVQLPDNCEDDHQQDYYRKGLIQNA